MAATELMDAALEYARNGFAVFPLKPHGKDPITKHGFKDATTDAEQIHSWWTETPDANIGIATGQRSGGIVVIDLDEDEEHGKHGIGTLGNWQRENVQLPPTLQAMTGRGGLHLYYRTDRTVKCSSNQDDAHPWPWVDVRGDGGYVCAPPSIHPNGTPYEWPLEFDAESIAAADENVLAFIDAVRPTKKTTKGGDRAAVDGKVKTGNRNDTLYRYACSLQGRGIDDATIWAYATEYNLKSMEPPLDKDEFAKTVRSALSHPKGQFFDTSGNFFAGAEKWRRDDKSMSRIFGKWLAGKVVFVPEEKGWRAWDGRHWVKDPDSQRVQRLMKQFVDEFIAYAQMCPDVPADERPLLVAFANGYNKLSTRKRLIEDVRCEVTRQRGEFDLDKNLLNLQNGTLDLDTLEFEEGHDPGDYCTKIAGAVYDPDATCAEWVEFLEQALSGDPDTIRYLQKVAGYSLTCDTSQECMFIFVGPTRSGKSTTANTLQLVLGDDEDGYATATKPESFGVSRYTDGSRPSSDIARLNGRRLVVTSEPAKNMYFNVALVKTLTGRDPITARFLNENEVTFYPVLKLIMTANTPPRVNDMTLFESDRVNVIPFPNHHSRAERDTTLKDRLTTSSSLSGILNWCIEGLRLYREEGLEPPAAVVKVTAQYARASDKIQQFLDDATEPSEFNTTGASMFTAWVRWCRQSGFEPGGKQTFFNDLRARHLLEDTATVSGKTVRNAVPGLNVLPEYLAS